jgi:ketohexokinase/beta-glucosidase
MSAEIIAIKVGRSRSAIFAIVKDKNDDENTSPSKPMGRPPKLGEKGKRLLVRTVKKNRRATLAEITNETGADVSMSTIRRALKDEGINNRIARLKPFLVQRHIAQRLVFAQEHLNWTMEQWSNVIWTDEATFEIGQNVRQLRVWRSAGEEYNIECTGSTFKSGRSSLMIWGQ